MYIRIVKYLGLEKQTAEYSPQKQEESNSFFEEEEWEAYHLFEYIIGTSNMKNTLFYSGDKPDVPLNKILDVSLSENGRARYRLVDDELYIRKKKEQTEEEMLECINRRYDLLVRDTPHLSTEQEHHETWLEDLDPSPDPCFGYQEGNQILDRLDLIYERASACRAVEI